MPNSHESTNGAEARLRALQQKHAVLASRIEEAQKHPATTDFYLRQLKKQKLVLKEQLEGVRNPSARVASNQIAEGA